MRTRGHFDGRGNPCTRIQVQAANQSRHTFDDVIIDTGYTGFLQLPEIAGLLLQLPPGPTVMTTFADNRSTPLKTVFGTVILQRRSRVGLILLSPTSPSILLGMDFLRTFGLVLVVSPTYGVALVDEAQVLQQRPTTS